MHVPPSSRSILHLPYPSPVPPPPPPARSYAALLREEGLDQSMSCAWPSWQSSLRAEEPQRGEEDSSVVIDREFKSGACTPESCVHGGWRWWWSG